MATNGYDHCYRTGSISVDQSETCGDVVSVDGGYC